jgi:hypothetical protein
MAAARALFRGDNKLATQILKRASTSHPELLFVSLALQLMGRGGKQLAKENLDFDDTVASKTDPYLRAISSLIATGDWTTIANQNSLPLSDRAFVAVRNFSDDQLTTWLQEQVSTAVKEGDEWVINAHKWYTTGAEGAAFAIAMVVTDPDAEPHHRTSLFIVETDNPGFEIVREVPVMGDHYVGGHCEVRFSDCRIPEKNLLGKQGEGFKLAQLRLGPGRITHAMRWLGVARRSLNEMIAYSLTKKDGDKTLADSQIIQNYIADSEAEIQASRLLTLHAAWKMDQGDEARKEVSLIKFYGAQILNNIIDRAIQTLGIFGLTPNTPLEGLYREARGARIYDGADEVHRMVVARQVIKEFQKKERLHEPATIPK